ncbi:MAG: Gfo/Idh/MocA family oxidoreductase [Deinococcota bacterium]
MALNVAIVGIGNIGKTHARVYQAHPDCTIVAVCDAITDKAQDAAQDYGAQAFGSISEMLASDVQVDVASVCTAGVENGGDHYEPTIELLNAGIAVLGEKPISNELSKAREMVALAKYKNIRYGINLNHRFTPAAYLAKDWVTQGKLGEPNMIDLTMWINNPNESSPYFHMRALHPHSFDIMRYFADSEVSNVHAFFKKGKGRDTWTNVQVNLLYQNGILGHLRGSYEGNFGAAGTYGLETLDVVGSEGRFVLQDACEHLTFYPRYEEELEQHDYLGGMKHFSETFDSRIKVWIDENLNATDPKDISASAEDALKGQTVIEACIESWETGQVVSL